jgi:hypothetical protein
MVAEAVEIERPDAPLASMDEFLIALAGLCDLAAPCVVLITLAKCVGACRLMTLLGGTP